MADLRKRIEWEIAGKADAYRRVLEQLPGETAESAKRSADAWSKAQAQAMAKQEAGITSSAKRSAAAWGDVGKKVAELAGGPFARLGQVVFDLVPKSSAAGSGMVAGLGGAATTVAGLWVGALAGVVAGIVGLTNAGLAAEERLVKAGRAAEIPEEARRSLALYRQEAKAIGETWDVAIATAGGAAANVGRGAVAMFTAWAVAVEDVRVGALGLAPAWDVSADKLNELRTILALTTAGLSELVIGWHAAGAAATASAELQTRASKLHLDQIQAEAEAEDTARKDNAKRAEELLKQRKADEAAEHKRRVSEATAAAKREREAKEREQQRYQDFLAGLRRDTTEREVQATEEGLERLIGFIEARQQAEVQADEARARLTAKGLADTISSIDTIQAEISAAQADAAENMASAVQSTSGAITQAAGLWREAVVDGTQAQKHAAAQFARFSKKAAVSSVVLNGIIATSAAAASAPPPFNIPAIAAAVADAAARTAVAVATPIPSAFAGSTPGEGVERRHAGESTLTAPATEQLMRLLNDRLSPLASLPGALAGAGAGGGDVYLDSRRVGRVVSGGRRSPPPGYRVSRR